MGLEETYFCYVPRDASWRNALVFKREDVAKMIRELRDSGTRRHVRKFHGIF